MVSGAVIERAILALLPLTYASRQDAAGLPCSCCASSPSRPTLSRNRTGAQRRGNGTRPCPANAPSPELALHHAGRDGSREETGHDAATVRKQAGMLVVDEHRKSQAGESREVHRISVNVRTAALHHHRPDAAGYWGISCRRPAVRSAPVTSYSLSLWSGHPNTILQDAIVRKPPILDFAASERGRPALSPPMRC